jgi:hypothetical protein
MISGYCLISLAFFVLKRLGNVRFFWKNLKWRAQKRNIYMLKGIRGYPDIPGKGSLMSQFTELPSSCYWLYITFLLNVQNYHPLDFGYKSSDYLLKSCDENVAHIISIV